MFAAQGALDVTLAADCMHVGCPLTLRGPLAPASGAAIGGGGGNGGGGGGAWSGRGGGVPPVFSDWLSVLSPVKVGAPWMPPE